MSNNIVVCGIIVLIVSLFLQNQRSSGNHQVTLLYVVLIGGIVYALMNNGKLVQNTGTVENLSDVDEVEVAPGAKEVEREIEHDASVENNTANEVYETIEAVDNANDVVLTAEDLLPTNGEDAFDAVEIVADNKDVQFLDAIGMVGMSTQRGTLNNHDLRCVPPIPKQVVGPWQQSTTEPDPYRRPLEGPECGGCSSNNGPVEGIEVN